MHFRSVNRCIRLQREAASVGSNVAHVKRSGTNRDRSPHRQRRSMSRMHSEAGSSPCVSTQKWCPHGQAVGAAEGSPRGAGPLSIRGAAHRIASRVRKLPGNAADATSTCCAVGRLRRGARHHDRGRRARTRVSARGGALSARGRCRGPVGDPRDRGRGDTSTALSPA